MKHKKLWFSRSTRKPGDPPAPWGGLQARLTVSYLGATLLAALLFQIFHSMLFLMLRLPLTWTQLVMQDIVGLLIASLIGGFIGVVSTRRLIQRLSAMSAATSRFAIGQYDQRLQVVETDEIGQLEAHFNQTAEQLISHLAQQELLVEQNARLQERTRLSRDLHDSIKQQIFALAVQIELTRSLLNQDQASARAHLDEADELSYQIQKELTTMIQALRPADLQTKGLSAALRDYVTAWSRQSRIVVDLRLPEMPSPLPSSIEEVLWRVAQEALSNIARHSQASRVQLYLERIEQHISLNVSDNGQGFDVASAEHTGLGLCSIRERIEQVQGTILIQSARGLGTHVVVRCRLTHTSESAPKADEVRT